MKFDVKIEDRVAGIEYLRMALSMAEIGVDYKTAELIDEIVTAVRIKNGKFRIDNAVDILCKWKKKWSEYFENISKGEQQ